MQWQILLCILAMLMDAQLTNEVGDMSVGVLMLVNVFMAMVVMDTRGDVVREAHEKA